MNKIAYGAFLFFFGIMLQWFFSSFAPVFGVAPQVVLVLTIALSSTLGPAAGQTFGFFWGLFLDVMAVHLFGANALLLSLMAYIVGVARRQMDVSNAGSQVMFTGLLSVLYFLLLGLLGAIFEGHWYWVGWPVFLGAPFLNAFLSPIGFFMVSSLFPVERRL